MGIAKGIGATAGAAIDGLGRPGSDLGRLDASRENAKLLVVVADRPVATSPANDVDLLEEGALVPALSDLRDLALVVEGHNVHLRGQTVSKRLREMQPRSTSM